jgi:hypothetical protein
MSGEAHLVEDLEYGARRYRLSEPWAGFEYVIVSVLTLPRQRLVTHVYGAEEDGPVSADKETRRPVVLAELEGQLSDQEALSTSGYQVQELEP